MIAERLNRIGLFAVGLPRPVKLAITITTDIVLAWIAAILAFYVRIGDIQFFTVPVVTVVAISTALFIPVFLFLGVYQQIFRFTGGKAINTIAAAAVIHAVPMALITLFAGIPNVPRTVGLAQPVLFLLLLVLSRLQGRALLVALLRRRGSGGAVKNVLVYGAGNAGQQLALSVRDEATVRLCGFVDDDRRLWGQRLDGVRVYAPAKIADIVDKDSITHIFLAIPSLSRAKRREIIDSLQHHRVHVQMLPSLQELVDGQASISDLRDMRVEDLLGRDPVRPNTLLMGKTITGRHVMVTGAGGSIGGEIARQIVRLRPASLVLCDLSEHALYRIDHELEALLAAENIEPMPIRPDLCNLGDEQTVRRIINRWRPDTIFHAAAYKHVPLVEANMISGMRNNIFATRHLARCAEDADVQNFVLISTDKAVRPTNIMGATKRVCELILQGHAARSPATRFAMVRFGNVLGSSGSVVPRFREQIEAGGPITLTHAEITRYFMTIPEAAQLVIQAGAMAQGGEVFVLDMGESVRIADLARSMIQLSGLAEKNAEHPNGDIEIVEVGLRPGEKLYEELLIGETSEPTTHPRISRAREQRLEHDALAADLDLLLGHLNDGEGAAALAILTRLVPEYRPAEQDQVQESA